VQVEERSRLGRIHWLLGPAAAVARGVGRGRLAGQLPAPSLLHLARGWIQRRGSRAAATLCSFSPTSAPPTTRSRRGAR
jgi:hypothetical protein